MTYSININSKLINPSKTLTKEEKIDNVIIEYALLAEILDLIEEQGNSKAILEKIKELKDTGILTKEGHSEAFNLAQSKDNQTLEQIRKLAGM